MYLMIMLSSTSTFFRDFWYRQICLVILLTMMFFLLYFIIICLIGGDMLVYLCLLSLSAQLVSVRSLCLYVPFISVLLSSAFYRAGGQARDVDPMLG